MTHSRIYIYAHCRENARAVAGIVAEVVGDFTDPRLAVEDRPEAPGRLAAILLLAGCVVELDIVCEGIEYRLENAGLDATFRIASCGLCGEVPSDPDECDLRTTRTSEAMPKWVMDEWAKRYIDGEGR